MTHGPSSSAMFDYRRVHQLGVVSISFDSFDATWSKHEMKHWVHHSEHGTVLQIFCQHNIEMTLHIPVHHIHTFYKHVLGKHGLCLWTQWCFHCSHMFLTTHPTPPLQYRDETILQLQAGHGSNHFRYLGISFSMGLLPNHPSFLGDFLESIYCWGYPSLFKALILSINPSIFRQACWAASCLTARLPAMMPHGIPWRDRDVWFRGGHRPFNGLMSRKFDVQETMILTIKNRIRVLHIFPSTNSGNSTNLRSPRNSWSCRKLEKKLDGHRSTGGAVNHLVPELIHHLWRWRPWGVARPMSPHENHSPAMALLCFTDSISECC